MSKKKVIVIGGGASGLMAAGIAAAGGAEVLLLEKMKSPARKLRITGKGRCNITNTASLPDFLHHFGPSGRFLRQAFHRFFVRDLIGFFEARGVQLNQERGGRIFPATADAPAVAQLLIDWVKSVGVTVQTGAAVEKLLIDDSGISGVLCNRKEIPAHAVILATGGASYPRTGSSGDGYRLAEEAGHTLVAIRPALVPLRTAETWFDQLDGLLLKNVNARLFINGKRKTQAFGEVGFIRSGLSGPVILTLSGMVVDALRAGQQVSISLDLKPALDEKKLEARLLRDLQQRAHDPMESFLRGLMPHQLVAVCLDNIGVDSTMAAGQLRAGARKKLRQWLKNFRCTITGYGSMDEAIITAGGIRTTEVDPRTMESRKVAGLYIVGEVLDIQADTGGYNLQAAFSTGWIAGKAAAV